MQGAEQFTLFIISIALAYGVGCLGRKRKIGFGWAFGLSILNLFLGLIVVLCSKKKSNDVEFVEMKNPEASLTCSVFKRPVLRAISRSTMP